MYEAEAKERAYRELNNQVACNSGYIGHSQAAANYPSPPKQPTVVSEIINRLENLHSLLRDAANSQCILIEKLHGPSPVTAIGEKGIQPNGGLLLTIDERLNWLLSTAQEINVNQQRLDGIA